MTGEYQRSQDHEQDALTFLGVTQEAGTAMAKAAGGDAGPDSPQLAEAMALFQTAYGQAQIHATLAAAAAVRALADVVDDLRRLLP